jgi:DNA polymerase-3 subunit delta
MKFTNLSAFEKHLQEAAPLHLARVYMVVAPTEFERRKIVEMVISAIKPDTQARFDALEIPVEKLIAELTTFSLFGKRPLTIFDGFDKLKKAALEPLLAYLSKENCSAFLILTATSLKGCQEVYEKGKKEGVLVDLSEEKSWDKEKRLREYLVKEAVLQGKTLDAALTAHLLKEIGTDMGALQGELFKLIAYTGSRSRITLDDASAICTSNHTQTGWQVAENIVWETTPAIPSSVDTTFLITLIGQIRYHLQVGMQIAEGTIPHLKSSQADKFIAKTRIYGPRYFRKSLEALFELELAAKSSGIAPDLLLEIFTTKLTLYKS